MNCNLTNQKSLLPTVMTSLFRQFDDLQLNSELASENLCCLNTPAPDNIDEFTTYEDYLDSMIVPRDNRLLEDHDLARQIVEHCRTDILTRQQFEEKKKARAELHLPMKRVKQLASIGKDLSGYPLLYALARREEYVRSGKLATIIFIRDIDKRGHEISGYIDYGHRLQTEDFEPYFNRKKKLLPLPTDLSYYNWKTQTLFYNNSSTFIVKSFFYVLTQQ